MLYRSAEADALALSGFTFGLDMVLEVGHLRVSEHQTVDEIHQMILLMKPPGMERGGVPWRRMWHWPVMLPT